MDEHPNVKVLRQASNLGYCAANNIGYRAVPDARYVLFLNPDAVVTPGLIAGAANPVGAPFTATEMNVDERAERAARRAFPTRRAARRG